MLHPEDAARIGNWEWRLEHLYQIRTKLAQKAVFKSNTVQLQIKRYFSHWHKFLILKAHQIGVSTLFLLWHLDATLFTPNTRRRSSPIVGIRSSTCFASSVWRT